MTNIHNSLISTALLALQQKKEVQFFMEPTERTLFCKDFVSLDTKDRWIVIVYMTPDSPTGFAIRVLTTADIPFILLLDRNLQSFNDFTESFNKDYSTEGQEAIRHRQQLSK